jgi:hypothetical protein
MEAEARQRAVVAMHADRMDRSDPTSPANNPPRGRRLRRARPGVQPRSVLILPVRISGPVSTAASPPIAAAAHEGTSPPSLGLSIVVLCFFVVACDRSHRGLHSSF